LKSGNPIPDTLIASCPEDEEITQRSIRDPWFRSEFSMKVAEIDVALSVPDVPANGRESDA